MGRGQGGGGETTQHSVCSRVWEGGLWDANRPLLFCCVSILPLAPLLPLPQAASTSFAPCLRIFCCSCLHFFLFISCSTYPTPPPVKVSGLLGHGGARGVGERAIFLAGRERGVNEHSLLRKKGEGDEARKTSKEQRQLHCAADSLGLVGRLGLGA